jgi:hypothetical protein
MVIPSSTTIDIKYLSDLVLETVAFLICSGLNILSSLYFIPSLNLGINTLLETKSIFMDCGTLNESLSLFLLLNLGYPFCFLKNLMN